MNVDLPDIAPLVIDLACQNSSPITMVLSEVALPTINGITSPCHGNVAQFPLFVQETLRTATGGVDEVVGQYARIMYALVSIVLAQFLELGMEQVRLYYLMTMRADALVCSVSREDKCLYFNVLVLQQQISHGIDPRATNIDLPKRVWLYWLQRAAIALNTQGVTRDKPTGLYDPAVRARFKQFCSRLNLA